MPEKTLSVSAIKEGTVVDHIASGAALSIVRNLKFAADGKRVTIGLNLKSASMGLKDIIKLEGVFLTATQASQIAVFAPTATVNVIENYRVAKKFQVSLPERIENLLICPNLSCITHIEKPATLFTVEDNNSQVLLKCRFCEKIFSLAESRVQSDD